MNILRTALVLLGVLVVAGAATAQQRQSPPPRIAIVDFQTIVQQLPETQNASKEYESIVKSWRDSLEMMAQDFQREAEQFQATQDMMQPAAREEKRRTLTQRQRQIEEYNAAKFDPRVGAAAELEARKLAPIREKVLKHIESVAKEEKVDIIFNRVGETLILFSDPKYDLTFRVLDRIKRGN